MHWSIAGRTGSELEKASRDTVEMALYVRYEELWGQERLGEWWAIPQPNYSLQAEDSTHLNNRFPSVPDSGDVTIEGNEVYSGL